MFLSTGPLLYGPVLVCISTFGTSFSDAPFSSQHQPSRHAAPQKHPAVEKVLGDAQLRRTREFMCLGAGAERDVEFASADILNPPRGLIGSQLADPEGSPIGHQHAT